MNMETTQPDESFGKLDEYVGGELLGFGRDRGEYAARILAQTVDVYLFLYDWNNLGKWKAALHQKK